jgi:hypothetical protein
VPARQHAPPRAALPPHRAPIANAVALARGITAFATGIRERGEDFGLTRSDVVVYAVAASAAIVTGWVVVVWATS